MHALVHACMHSYMHLYMPVCIHTCILIMLKRNFTFQLFLTLVFKMYFHSLRTIFWVEESSLKM